MACGWSAGAGCDGSRLFVRLRSPSSTRAVEAGADLLGFNFYTRSKRYISPHEARAVIEKLPAGVVSVGVFVNEDGPEAVERIACEAGVGAAQLHGDESPEDRRLALETPM